MRFKQEKYKVEGKPGQIVAQYSTEVKKVTENGIERFSNKESRYIEIIDFETPEQKEKFEQYKEEARQFISSDKKVKEFMRNEHNSNYMYHVVIAEWNGLEVKKAGYKITSNYLEELIKNELVLNFEKHWIYDSTLYHIGFHDMVWQSLVEEDKSLFVLTNEYKNRRIHTSGLHLKEMVENGFVFIDPEAVHTDIRMFANSNDKMKLVFNTSMYFNGKQRITEESDRVWEKVNGWMHSLTK
jgi:predicted AlkP superfamily pyrophosphatase or phosphodiesterase